jgi:hypothetical protein
VLSAKPVIVMRRELYGFGLAGAELRGNAAFSSCLTRGLALADCQSRRLPLRTGAGDAYRSVSFCDDFNYDMFTWAIVGVDG